MMVVIVVAFLRETRERFFQLWELLKTETMDKMNTMNSKTFFLIILLENEFEIFTMNAQVLKTFLRNIPN